jgi:hypothetical protein
LRRPDQISQLLHRHGPHLLWSDGDFRGFRSHRLCIATIAAESD